MEVKSPVLSVSVILALAFVVSLVTSTFVASRAYLQRGDRQERQSWTLDVSSEGINDASSIDKDVTAVVHLPLSIEPQES